MLVYFTENQQRLHTGGATFGRTLDGAQHNVLVLYDVLTSLYTQLCVQPEQCGGGTPTASKKV